MPREIIILVEPPTMLPSAEIERREEYLLGLGFAQDWIGKLRQSRPALFDPEHGEKIISLLQELGFKNPLKMVESSPPILGLAEQNIRDKLSLLQELGFKNPLKMVESSPPILGYAEQNIRRRVRLFGRIIRLYNLPFSPTELMEESSPLFSSKLDKLLVLARILREFEIEPQEIERSIINRLLWANLGDVLVALDESSPESEDIAEFLKRLGEVKRRGLSRREKRQVIKAGLDNFAKIKRRYLRGYP